MRPFLFLAAYWAIFWHKFLKNPYLLSTSEIASTYFPFWRWMGQELSAGRYPLRDEIYYRFPHCIPFLSTFYPPNLLTAWLGSKLSIDMAFLLFAMFVLSHYLFGSIIAYFCFRQWAGPLSALFGAITLTYAAYCIKPQTPAATYSMAWLPGTLLGGWFGGICFAMSLLGGYYPVIIYVVPFLCFICPGAILHGLLLGSPQIIPFLWYYKRSIRWGQPTDPTFGRIPILKLIDFVWPTNSVIPTANVLYPEVEMYMGIISFFFVWHWSWLWIAVLYSLLVMLGFLPPLQRIPARVIYLLTLSISILATQGSCGIPLSVVFLQGFLLFSNSNIYPSFPFSQWWRRPSDLDYADTSKWPGFTGYMINRPGQVYRGGFCLKENG